MTASIRANPELLSCILLPMPSDQSIMLQCHSGVGNGRFRAAIKTKRKGLAPIALRATKRHHPAARVNWYPQISNLSRSFYDNHLAIRLSNKYAAKFAADPINGGSNRSPFHPWRGKLIANR